MALDDHFDASRLAGKIVRVPRLPVAGFWVRLIAFVVDWIILTFFFYLLAMVAREGLLALGKWASTLAALVIFAYFWLGDGPVGKGRTVGKALMGLRTVRASDGGIIAFGPAALRAFVLLPPVIWFKEFIIPVASPSPASAWQVFFFIILPQNLFLALYIGQIVHCGFNPTRQGFHDAFADSLVLGMDHRDTTWQTLEEEGGPPAMERARKARRSGWIGFAVVLLFSGYLRGQQIQQMKADGFFETNERLTETLDRYGVEMVGGQKRLPIAGDEGAKAEGKSASGESASKETKTPAASSPQKTGTASTADKATSPSLEPPKEFEIYLLHYGRDTRPESEIRRDTNDLADWLMGFFHDQMEREQQRRAKAEAEGKTPPPNITPEIPKGTQFTFYYQEYLDLVLYQKGYDILEVQRTY